VSAKRANRKRAIELRSQCKALVDKWEKDSEAGGRYFVITGATVIVDD